MTGADLRFYLHLLTRWLPLMTVTGGIVAALGLSYVLSLPPIYEATGTILVELPQIPAKLAPAPDSVGALTRLQIIQQELLTHDALVALAKRQRIYSANDMPTPATMVRDLRGRIRLEPVTFNGSQEALGFTVSFTADNPELAARVANDLIATILQRDASSRLESADATLSFFDGEVNRLTGKIEQIETRLKDFKTRNLDALPDTMAFRRTLQINLRDRLLVLDTEQSSLQSRRAGYVAFYRQTGAIDNAPAQTPEQAQLAELKRTLASQRTLFADDSPTIRALEQQIEVVQAALQAGVDAATPTGDGVSPLDLQLADIDDRLRSISVERDALQRNDAQLSTSIAATPGVEAALNSLEREHDNAQTLYNAAVARRAEALASQQVESRLKGDRLTLMESALPPERPVGPKRFQFALGVLAVALLAALSVLGLEFLKPGVRRAAEIEQKLGIEVLAVVPQLPNRRPRRFSLSRLLRGKHIPLEALPQ